MAERMSAEGLAAKIGYEGGLFDTLTYGITSEEVPEEVQEAWKRAEAAKATFDLAAAEIEEFLSARGRE